MTAASSSGAGGPEEAWTRRDVHRLRLVADPSQPGIVWFHPLAPVAETDDAGNPSATLILTGGSGILSVGATLSVSEAALAEARAAAQELLGRSDVAVQLKPAPLLVSSATLELAGPQGWVSLAKSTSSGYPPFNAVFSANLDAAAAAAAASAFRGGTGHLFVRYEVQVTLPSAPPQRPPGRVPPTTPAASSIDQVSATSPEHLSLEADVASWLSHGASGHLLVT